MGFVGPAWSPSRATLQRRCHRRPLSTGHQTLLCPNAGAAQHVNTIDGIDVDTQPRLCCVLDQRVAMHERVTEACSSPNVLIWCVSSLGSP